MDKIGDAIAKHLRDARPAREAGIDRVEGQDAKRTARKAFTELRGKVIYPALCQAHDAVRKFDFRARCHFDQPGRYASDGELPAVLELDREVIDSARIGQPLDCALVWCLEVGPPVRVRAEWHGIPERCGLGRDVIHFALEETTAEIVTTQVLEFVRVATRTAEA